MIVLGGIYSFLMATVLVALDAVDVAMTEASVGAGISTVLLLGALYLCKSEEAKPAAPALAAAGGVGWPSARLLVYGTLGLPAFSDPEAPIHTHVVPRYLQRDAHGDRRAERGDGRARELSRLRHAGRDHRRLHRRRRRDRAAAAPARRKERRAQ